MPFGVKTDTNSCSESEPYAVYNTDTGDIKACHATRGKALSHQRALMANYKKMSEYETAEIFLSSDAEEEDGLVWKDILREGEWAYSPGPNQEPVPVPIKVIDGKSDNDEVIGMDNIIESFEDKAIDTGVTVPLRHTNRADENTGWVRKLKKIDRDGKKVLRAGIGFTEKDIEDKVKRDTIKSTSAGLAFDYINKENGKSYAQVLDHVNLTNRPWLTGLNASEDKETLHLSQDINDTVTGLANGGVVKVEPGTVLANLDNSYIVVNIEDFKKLSSQGEASDEGGNTTQGDKMGKKEGEESSSVATEEKPEVDASKKDEEKPEAKAEGISAEAQKIIDDQNEKIAEQKKQLESLGTSLSETQEVVHKKSVNERIQQLSDAGFKAYPGLLTEIRRLLLADTKKTKTLKLSEEKDGKESEVELSASDVVERIVKAMPWKEDRLNFSDQALIENDHSKPESETKKQDYAAIAKELGIEGYPESKKEDGDK